MKEEEGGSVYIDLLQGSNPNKSSFFSRLGVQTPINHVQRPNSSRNERKKRKVKKKLLER